MASGFCSSESSEKSHETDDNPGYLSLERIFTSEEFKVEDFGPARWLEDGFGYTTLEDSQTPEEKKPPSCCEGPEDERPKDVVRYEPETGMRKISGPF